MRTFLRELLCGNLFLFFPLGHPSERAIGGWWAATMPEPLEGAFQSGGALHPYLLDLDFSTASADSCLCHGVICVSFGAQGRQGLCASSLEKRCKSSCVSPLRHALGLSGTQFTSVGFRARLSIHFFAAKSIFNPDEAQLAYLFFCCSCFCCQI